MTFVPKGIIPAMVTPLTSDWKVNEKGLRRLIDFLIDGGSHGLFVVGTTGEFYGLSPEEKKELFEITVDQTRGRVPVYAGTGAITTREVIQLTHYAEDAKVDAVSVLTPMFISPTQNELIAALYCHRRLNRFAGTPLQQPAQDRGEPHCGHSGKARRRAEHHGHQGFIRRFHPFRGIHSPNQG